MTKRWRWLVPMTVIAVLAGCSKSEDAMNEQVKPPGDSPYNNNDPRAKSAPAASGPGPNVPRMGGGGKGGATGKN
jgi:hypothetical protein